MLLEKLGGLAIGGSPTDDVPVAFRNTDGEVYFRRVVIFGGGDLRTVLQNRWEDGKGSGGFYSLLHHAQELEIWNNPQAVRDLVSYVEGTYLLGGHWWQQRLPRDMKIVVQCEGVDLLVAERLKKHFDAVEVHDAVPQMRGPEVQGVEDLAACVEEAYQPGGYWPPQPAAPRAGTGGRGRHPCRWGPRAPRGVARWGHGGRD